MSLDMPVWHTSPSSLRVVPSQRVQSWLKQAKEEAQGALDLDPEEAEAHKW